MIGRGNKNMQYVPPSIMEETAKMSPSTTKIVGLFIFISILLLYKFSASLDSMIIFGRYLWLIPLALFLVYIIIISSKINKSLKKKNTDIKTEYNRYGDSLLFNFATRNGNLRLFDIKKGVLMAIIMPFAFVGLTFGFLALHLALFKGISQFVLIGIVAVIVCTGATFLFLFEDRRILSEARRRNQFVDMATRRWVISKIIYILLLILSITCASILIANDKNFLIKGVLISDGQVIYDGRR